jgi:hypothetical protein
MNELAYCTYWGEKLAARHPDDLTPAERGALEQHLRECSVCATTFKAFHTMEMRIRALPQAPSLPSLLSQFQQLPQEEKSNITNSKCQQNAPQQCWQEAPALATHLPISTVRTYLMVVKITCIDSYSEVIADDSDTLECLIESLISVILADHFDRVIMEEVIVQFTPGAQHEESQWNIHMTASGTTSAFSSKQHVSVFTQQQQLEGLEFVVEDKVSCGLLELFSVILVDAVEIFAKDSEMTGVF